MKKGPEGRGKRGRVKNAKKREKQTKKMKYTTRRVKDALLTKDKRAETANGVHKCVSATRCF